MSNLYSHIRSDIHLKIKHVFFLLMFLFSSPKWWVCPPLDSRSMLRTVGWVAPNSTMDPIHSHISRDSWTLTTSAKIWQFYRQQSTWSTAISVSIVEMERPLTESKMEEWRVARSWWWARSSGRDLYVQFILVIVVVSWRQEWAWEIHIDRLANIEERKRERENEIENMNEEWIWIRSVNS